MLDHRQRRWPNTVKTLHRRIYRVYLDLNTDGGLIRGLGSGVWGMIEVFFNIKNKKSLFDSPTHVGCICRPVGTASVAFGGLHASDLVVLMEVSQTTL